MFEVHNKITVASEEQARHLESAFSGADHRMAHVAGFREFHLLKSEDGGHYMVRIVWDSEETFHAWAKSDDFRRAHSGQDGNGMRTEVSLYQIVL